MKNIFYISLLIFQISLAQNAFDEGNKYPQFIIMKKHYC